MSTVEQYIQTKIADVQTKANAEIAQYQADLAAISAGSPSTLTQDMEAVKVWFQSLKNHIEGL